MSWNINNDLIQGDDLLLYLTSGKTVVAYATSCSIQVDQETIDTSSKFSCRWNANMGGRASYTISADALYCNSTSGVSFDELLEMMVAGDNVEWYMGQESAYTVDETHKCEDNPHALDTAKPYYGGKALVTSVSLEAGNNEIATCSITLTGSEAIVKYN